MPIADITNPTVSVTLGSSESVTVPTGEVWKVRLTMRQNARPDINGVNISDGYTDNHGTNTDIADVILTGGDTVEETSSQAGSHLGGFVVDGGGGDHTIDNTPISEQIGASGSLSVPTGETWRVTIIARANCRYTLNGVSMKDGYNGPPNTVPTDTVLTGGDTIEGTNGNAGLHVSGWKV